MSKSNLASRPVRERHDRETLVEDLGRLGVAEGDIVLMHSSLRRIGPVVGGAGSVVRALLDVLGPRGTLVAPTFTANNSNPSRWEHTGVGSVPADRWPGIRASMPPFDPETTPSFKVGVITETIRTWPGAIRSAHPQTSFAAIGAAAEELMAAHPNDCHLGPESPLGALARSNAKILLLGVSFAICTAFHLAEYLVGFIPQRDYECVIKYRGGRQWYRYRDVCLDDSDFERLGRDFEGSRAGTCVRQGPVGDAPGRLFSMPDAVDFARAWMSDNRSP